MTRYSYAIGVHSNEIHQGGSQTIANARLAEAYRSSTLRLFTHRLRRSPRFPASSACATWDAR